MRGGVTCLAIVLACAGLASYGGAWAQSAPEMEPGEASGQERDGSVVTIEVGTTSVPPIARAWFEGEIRSFQEAHPDIRVKTTALVQPLRPENPIESLPRLAEDVVGIVGINNEETSYLASRGLIVPVEEFLPDADLNLDDFYSNVWPVATFEGRVWGIPWCLDSMWLVCDWPLFEEAGIEEPPETWEEFMDCAKRLTKDTDGDGRIDQWGFRLPHDILNVPLLLELSILGQMGREDERANFELLRDLTQSSFVKRDYRISFAGFGDDSIRCGMQFMYNFEKYDPYLYERARELFEMRRFRFAFMPSSGGSATPSGLRYFLAVRRSTPEREAASWEFIKWISRRDVTLPDVWYGFPCRKDLLMRDDFKRFAARSCQDFRIAFQSMALSRIDDDPAKQMSRDFYAKVRAPLLMRALRGEMEYAEYRQALESAEAGRGRAHLDEGAGMKYYELFK